MLSDQQLERYGRQIILDHFGEEGQEALSAARVALVGVGGLGCVVGQYLASSGVGNLLLWDHDVIELSNLPRQVLYDDADLGRSKARVAAERLGQLVPDGTMTPIEQRFCPERSDLLSDVDLVIDACDTYLSRAAVADCAARLDKVVVSGAVQGYHGHVTTIRPEPEHCCFHCLFPAPPDDQAVSRCEQIGILAPVAGVIGCIMATEAIKFLISAGSCYTDAVYLFDGLHGRSRLWAMQGTRRACRFCAS